MNENFFANLNLQPMLDTAEINSKMFEKLTTLQSEYMTYCLNGCIEQFKSLAENQGPQAATERQFQFFKDMEAKLRNTTKQEAEALNEAQKAVTEVLQESYTSMSSLKNRSTDQPESAR